MSLPVPPSNAPPPRRSRATHEAAGAGSRFQTGHALIVQLLIGLIVIGVIAVPIFLITFSKARQRGQLLSEINGLITSANEAKAEVKAAYKRIRKTKPLRHSASVVQSYDKEFHELFRRAYDLRKRNAGEGGVAVDDLIGMKRDLEAYKRRLDGHHRRVSTLLRLTDEAETAIQLARFYQSALPIIRRHAPYGPNKTLLPQLAEATRQFGTGMGFAISGIAKFPEDLRGQETPTLIKAGIEQIHRVAAEVDDVLWLLRGTKGIELGEPAAGARTLDAYIETVLKEGERRRG